jgi:hypothetical protein
MGAVVLCALGSGVAQSQQCIGLPARLSLNATYLQNSPGRASTVSVGIASSIGSTPLFVSVEGGREDSHTALLDKPGYFGDALIGISTPSFGPFRACAAGGRAQGSQPSADGAPATSLNATGALVGLSADLVGSGDAAKLALFADWQHSWFDGSGDGGIIRGGLLLTPWQRVFARANYDIGTGEPHAKAFGVSLGVRW